MIMHDDCQAAVVLIGLPMITAAVMIMLHDCRAAYRIMQHKRADSVRTTSLSCWLDHAPLCFKEHEPAAVPGRWTAHDHSSGDDHAS